MYNVHASKFVTVTTKDEDFYMNDGMTAATRAAVQINVQCPQKYQQIITECIDRGWLTVVATIYDYEQTYSRLKS